MSEREQALRLLRGAAGAIEQSRRRIDDLNVYPVPDGDTGTNLALTARAVVDAIEVSEVEDGVGLAREVTRAALMGARGNSGVILSQIVRGAADSLAADATVDSAAIARALRAATEAAYRAVRKPVEGTMLTVIRELAEAAEREPEPERPPVDSLHELVRVGEDAVQRTPDQLDVLRNAGVVDAGGAGLVELLRGIAAAAADEPLPETPALTPVEEPAIDAIHQEPSRYRYCTTFVIEGQLDPDEIERHLDPLGDSLLVVGDAQAVKAHVHTDDPGAALSVGTAVGAIGNVEINDMHRQIEARERRLLTAVPDTRSAVVAVVVGDGNRRLFESLGAAELVEGGQTMNPATSDLVAAIDRARAAEVLLLPNNENVVLSADQAARLSGKTVGVVPTRSLQEGLAALVAFDPGRSADENAAEMKNAAAQVATGAVTRASRPVEINGRRFEPGAYLGLVDGQPVAGGDELSAVAENVVELLLAQPRGVLTLLTGEDDAGIDGLVDAIQAENPELEIEFYEGGQPHYPLLISAE